MSSNWNNLSFGYKYFFIAFLLMETLLIAVFVVLDLMLFYVSSKLYLSQCSLCRYLGGHQLEFELLSYYSFIH
jgi:hypothetical protein